MYFLKFFKSFLKSIIIAFLYASTTFASFHVLEKDFWTKEKNNYYATLSIVSLHQNNNYNNKKILTYGINIILQYKSLMYKPIIINISSSNHNPEKSTFTHQRYKFKSGTIQGGATSMYMLLITSSAAIVLK